MIETTITRITRADWGAAMRATARLMVPAIALAYVAGMALGTMIHDLNAMLASLVSPQPAPAPAVAKVMPAALPPAAGAPLALPYRLHPVYLATLSNRELRELVGTRRRLPKQQLIALAMGAA
jgi:hypothetical protein